MQVPKAVLRSARWLLFIAVLSLLPAASYAGVYISVGFAPPVLPVYVQPPCPEPGLMWMPGYWAYGDDGYYWVPGAWVPAPYEGALWTPPYWGWGDGVYMFHPGYWGRHVGYYGGVNYGFGYMGIGFVGGEWREHHFAYNTAVVNVNRTVIHETYVNETIVHERTIVNERHVAYAGGPGGIRHDPLPEERAAMHEAHVEPTRIQQEHIQAARMERANYFKTNGGHPQNVVATRPLLPQNHPVPVGPAMHTDAHGSLNGQLGGVHGNVNGNAAAGGNARPAPVGRPENRPAPIYQPPTRPAPAAPAQGRSAYQPQEHPGQPAQYGAQPHPAPESHPAPQAHPGPTLQSRPAPEYRPAPQAHPAPQAQYHPAPQPRVEQPQYHPPPQPQYHPAPQAQYHPAPQPRFEQAPSRPAPQAQYHPAPQPRPEPQVHQAPPRPESRPAPDSRPRDPHHR